MVNSSSQNNSKSLNQNTSSKNSLHSEEKAQAEAVFRLMIDSIVGIAILLIIVSVIGYFNTQVIDQSKSDLIKWVRDASNSPDGSILTSGDLTFSKGFGVSAESTQEWTGVSSKCFGFDANPGVITLLGEQGALGYAGLEFNQNLTTKVYVQCKSSQNPSSCNPKTPPSSSAMKTIAKDIL